MNNPLQALAYKNIKHERLQSLSLIFLLAFMTLTLFLTSSASLSVRQSFQRMEDRLGADLIVRREEWVESKEENSSIDPQHAYLDESIIEDIKKVEGVGQVSPQLDLKTTEELEENNVQRLVGIDWQTDFTIRPWLEEDLTDFESNQLIVGTDIQARTGEKLSLAGQSFEIVGQLEPTSSDYDQSIFLPLDQAQAMALQNQAQLDVQQPISQLMVNDDGTTTTHQAVANIHLALKDPPVQARAAEEMTAQFSQQVKQTAPFLLALATILFFLSLIIVCLIFYNRVRSRQDQWQSLKIVGAKNQIISRLLLKENLILSVMASAFGLILAWIILFILPSSLSSILSLPITPPSLLALIILSFTSFLVISLIGPLTSQLTIKQIF